MNTDTDHEDLSRTANIPVCTVKRMFEMLKRSPRTSKMSGRSDPRVVPDPPETPGSNLPYQVHQLEEP